jgi:hypothetical protein
MPVECGSAADCAAGQVCCAKTNGRYNALVCQSEPCVGGDSAQICYGDAPCPSGETCGVSSTLPAGYPRCE